MDSLNHLEELEVILGRHFQNQAFLRFALTAADRSEEGECTEGNRSLAFVGDPLIKLVISISTSLDLGSRSDGHKKCQSFSQNDVLADIARNSGIDRFIQASPRQKERPLPTGVLAKAVKAIVAATWIDCGGDLRVINDMICRLSHHSNAALEPLWQSTIDQSFTTAEAVNPALLSTFALNDRDEGQPGITTRNSMPCVGTASDYHQSLSMQHIKSLESRLSDCVYPETFCALVDETTTGGVRQFNFGEHDRSNQWPLSAENEIEAWHAAESPTRLAFQLSERPQSHEPCLPQVESITISSDYVSNNVRKRKKSHRSTAPPIAPDTSPKARQLQDFIKAEKDKYASSSPLHQGSMDFLQAGSQYIVEFGLETCATSAKLFYYVIPSHLSIIGLQKILGTHRNRTTNQPCVSENLSNAQRYILIQNLESQIGNVAFWRRYHIWRLYVKCLSAYTTEVDSGFVISTPAKRPDERPVVPGNPIALAKAQTIDTMVSEIVPGFSEMGKNEKDSCRKRVKRMAALGARLHRLISNVDLGILALLPQTFEIADIDECLCITDGRIMDFKNDEFAKLVRLLGSQDSPFTIFSKAARVVVESIVEHRPGRARRFVLENASTEEISSHPGGSKALLQYLDQLDRDIGVDM